MNLNYKKPSEILSGIGLEDTIFRNLLWTVVCIKKLIIKIKINGNK